MLRQTQQRILMNHKYIFELGLNYVKEKTRKYFDTLIKSIWHLEEQQKTTTHINTLHLSHHVLK